jgi:DNA phosphorothioation-dependent restriction protein DptG
MNSILQRLLSNEENNTQWLLVCYCLVKTNKISSNQQQLKSIVFTYVRDLIVDLFNVCKTCSQLEIILTNLTQILPYIIAYEQSVVSVISLGTSPISTNKSQQSDNILLNKILLTIQTVFESSNGSSLLQLIYPLLIFAFQHNKTIIRTKTRKCWNETFGRLTFIVYPNELR